MPLSLKEKRDLLHGGNEHPPKHQQHANNAYTRTYIDRTIHIWKGDGYVIKSTPSTNDFLFIYMRAKYVYSIISHISIELTTQITAIYLWWILYM